MCGARDSLTKNITNALGFVLSYQWEIINATHVEVSELRAEHSSLVVWREQGQLELASNACPVSQERPLHARRQHNARASFRAFGAYFDMRVVHASIIQCVETHTSVRVVAYAAEHGGSDGHTCFRLIPLEEIRQMHRDVQATATRKYVDLAQCVSPRQIELGGHAGNNVGENVSEDVDYCSTRAHSLNSWQGGYIFTCHSPSNCRFCQGAFSRTAAHGSCCCVLYKRSRMRQSNIDRTLLSSESESGYATKPQTGNFERKRSFLCRLILDNALVRVVLPRKPRLQKDRNPLSD